MLVSESNIQNATFTAQEHNEQFSTKGVKCKTNKPKQVGSFRQRRIGGFVRSLFLVLSAFCVSARAVLNQVLSVTWEVSEYAPRC